MFSTLGAMENNIGIDEHTNKEDGLIGSKGVNEGGRNLADSRDDTQHGIMPLQVFAEHGDGEYCT